MRLHFCYTLVLFSLATPASAEEAYLHQMPRPASGNMPTALNSAMLARPIAIVPKPAISPGAADYRQNVAIISQTGYRNNANVIQSGAGNSSYVVQQGALNHATVSQRGGMR